MQTFSLSHTMVIQWSACDVPLTPNHNFANPLLGNSGKPVTLETLGSTKFSKHVFQEQGIHDFWKPGTCEASNS
jgi:hypothetical protein